MYDLLYDLVKAKNLLEANLVLKKIDDGLSKNEVNRSTFCKKLSQAIIQWTMVEKIDLLNKTKPKYHIYHSNKSIPPYLFSYGLTIGKVREMRKNIKDRIKDIDETIIEPSCVRLTVEDEEKILSVLSNKFPFLEIITASKTLDIININNTYRLYNSMCGISGDSASFVIYMYNMKDKAIAPEYVFLHELGHVLQFALTDSNLIVPDGFIEFNKSVLKKDLGQGNNGTVEIFADMFAISVMHGTDLCKFNPFSTPNEFNEACVKFFVKLTEKYSGTVE